MVRSARKLLSVALVVAVMVGLFGVIASPVSAITPGTDVNYYLNGTAPQDLTALSPAQIWVGVTNSDNNGRKINLKVEVYKNETLVGSGELLNKSVAGNALANSIEYDVPLSLVAGSVSFVPGDQLKSKVSVQRVGGSGDIGVRMWYDNSTGGTNRGWSRFDATIGGTTNYYYYRSCSALAASPGSSAVSSTLTATTAYQSFGTWTTPKSPQATSIPLPTVTGPILETPTSHAFDPAAGTDYLARGYVQEEYFISGTANEYELVNPGDTSSFAVKVRTPALPYKTRILVRRPANPSLFSGNVIVEFMNPSGGYDIATAWACFYNQIMRNGDVWVGVTCKKTILLSTCTPSLPQGLMIFDIARYGTLSFARDRAQAWDIFTQLGALLKSSGPSNPLVADGLNLTDVKLIGHGYSQTGGYLITYINFFHSLAQLDNGLPVYDGYLASAAAGPIWINDDGMSACVPSMGFGPNPPTDPRRVIQPCGVPVIHTLTETEIALPSADLNAIVTRRPDSDVCPDFFRRYEIPGACHKGAGSPGPTNADLCKTMWYVCPWCCTGTHSDFPVQYIHNGILVNMENWIRSGTLPPKGDRIQTDAGGAIIRDAFGNAKGGVRTPYVDVPVKRYFPYSSACSTCPNTPGLCATNPPTICVGCSAWCVILGNMVPFEQATLKGLYKNHEGYVSKFVKSTQQLFKNGWVVAADMELMKTKAAESDVLK